MKALVVVGIVGAALALHAAALADGARPEPAHIDAVSDARLPSVRYAPDRVVRVPVRRGQVTHIVLPEDEHLQGGIATGQGADCNDASHAWCVTGSGRDLFVKPRGGATRNTLAVVGSRRRHSFELALAADDEPAVLRLTVLPPQDAVRLQAIRPVAHEAADDAALQDIVADRLRRPPPVVNTAYSLATGTGSDDIVPRLVFDDGQHTHFRFAPGQPLPAVFEQRAGDEQPEQMVNLHVEGDHLVADRVARRFMLRLGSAVVSVVNEAFDPLGPPQPDGTPATAPAGTRVPGVRRVLVETAATTAHRGDSRAVHEAAR